MDNGGPMPRLFPGSIPGMSRARHGFWSGTVFIAIFTSWFRQRGRFISRSMQNSARARVRRDRRNIYLAIRTCNNSGYSTARAGRCTTRPFSPFMQSIPCLISTGIFYANDAPPSSLLHKFFDKSSEQRVEKNRCATMLNMYRVFKQTIHCL